MPACRGVDTFMHGHGCMCIWMWIGVKKKTKRKKKTHLEPGEGQCGHTDVLHVHADADEYRERSKINKKNLHRDIRMEMGMRMRMPCVLIQGLRMCADGCVGMWMVALVCGWWCSMACRCVDEQKWMTVKKNKKKKEKKRKLTKYKYWMQMVVDANGGECGCGGGCRWWWMQMVVNVGGGGCGWWWMRMMVKADVVARSMTQCLCGVWT